MALQTPGYDTESEDQDFRHPLDDARGHKGSLADAEQRAAGDSSDPRGPDDKPAGKSSDPRGDVANKEGLFNADGDKSLGKGGLSSAPLAGAASIIKGGGVLGAARGLFRGRRRKAAGGGIVATIIGAVIFAGTIASGPLQLEHLSMILQTFGHQHEKDTASRTKGLYRFARTGDVNETSVGYFGSRSANRSISTLKEMGIDVNTRSTFGSIKSITYDSAKLSKAYPELKNASLAETKAFLSEKLGVPVKSFGNLGSGSDVGGYKVSINRSNNSSAENYRLLREHAKLIPNGRVANALKLPQDGKIMMAIKMRPLAKFYGVPSMWHPIKKQTVKITNKLDIKIDRRKAAKARETARAKLRAPAESSRYIAARENMKSKINGIQSKVGGALLITGGMCVIRSVATDVPEVNRGAIVVPSVLEAADKTAVGSQNMSNKDIAMEDDAAIVETFTDDKGASIWQSRALQAISNPTYAGGQDIDTKYKQAFLKDTTAENIKSTFGGGSFGAAACSPLGSVVQLAGGLILILGAVPTDGGSLAAFAAAKGASVAASAGAIYFLEKGAVDYFKTNKAVPEIFAGPEGGNLLAYGAKEAANISSRSDGGTARNNTQTAALEKQAQFASQKQFRTKSLFAQIFDVHDYRTPAAKFTDRLTSNPAKNIAMMTNSFLGALPSLIPHAISTLIPTSHAAIEKKPYDWGFPDYGLPSDLLKDKNYEDPYDNADKVAAVLNDTANPDYASGLKDRASKCFGVKIDNPDGRWGAVSESETNPNGEDYLSAHCDDTSDPNWKRMMLFVFDTRTMSSIACYEGEESACADFGIGGAANSETATGSAASTDDGNCNGGKSLGAQDAYVAGQKSSVKICAMPAANGTTIDVASEISSNVKDLLAAAKKDNIEFGGSGFRSMSGQESAYAAYQAGTGAEAAKPGYSNHQSGLAIDFSLGGQTLCYRNPASACFGNKGFDWLKNNASKYGLKNYPNEAWHWSTTGN
ncbi:MAG: D-alanyl-D-alanine carboxypeptidase family protein [Patescibacteria group bacterium]|nr:D-alanyl-D-alanine carboxypeptidase family protein [Patescibacteria group bacterium]